MTSSNDTLPILMVDDDKDDCAMTERALRKNRVMNPILFLSDGEELMDYLRRVGSYSDPRTSPRPCFILLDLNMPKMNGREALEAIKSDPELKEMPVVMLTTSRSEEDVNYSYKIGANSFITKPIDFAGLVAVISALKHYWLEIVELPRGIEKNPGFSG